MNLTKTNGTYRLDATALAALAAAREARGLTHADVAAKLGIGVTHLKRLERGYSVPTWQLLARWGRAVGCEVTISVRAAME